jgi:hypothetical protein
LGHQLGKGLLELQGGSELCCRQIELLRLKEQQALPKAMGQGSLPGPPLPVQDAVAVVVARVGVEGQFAE